MPTATITRGPTAHVSATVENGSAEGSPGRAPTGRVTARLHIFDPGE